MTSAIAIERICMEFGTPGQGLKALDDVSLDIHANEFFTLLGPSGCGKTTLLRLIAGFEQPSSGSIRLYGERMEGLPPFRRPVNTVFQSYALFPHMSVAENIGFGLEMQGRPRSEIDATVSRMLDLVKLPEVASAAPTSCPVASSNASPWPARWPAGPRCCCSTSRCRRWT